MLEKNAKRWIEEWKQEGRTEGRVEGQTEERIRLAKRMLSKGMTVSYVAELTELTREEVQKLKDAGAH